MPEPVYTEEEILAALHKVFEIRRWWRIDPDIDSGDIVPIRVVGTVLISVLRAAKTIVWS